MGYERTVNPDLEERILNLEIQMSKVQQLVLEIANKLQIWEDTSMVEEEEEEERMEEQQEEEPNRSITRANKPHINKANKDRPQDPNEKESEVEKRQAALETNMASMLEMIQQISVSISKSEKGQEKNKQALKANKSMQ